ncbi:MAG: HEAT repeat domain-containing protein, partial [Spirochaetaceae bacterium]|nr:HEAT repeat domain-containing protein [Spirochaetaceae bacterium]
MPVDQSVGADAALAAEPILLDDRQMREFVTRGYLTFRLDLPDAFHRRVRERALEDIRRCEEAGTRSPLNNALPRIPALRRVFDHPFVAGALTSILGAGYYLHLHRHMHDNRPGSDAQTIHQDSLGNSRYAVDGNRRHHHCRWAMAFYYPQDTTLDMGPSAVAPCSQYLTEGAGLDAEQALEGPAGTVTIVHYDLFHRGLANWSGDTRLMIKFLFARMEEPVRPSWNAAQAAWPEEPGSDARDRQRVWRHHWRWFRGESAANGDGAAADVRALERDLDHADEWRGLAAAYGLGAAGAAGAPALLAALTGSDPVARRRAAYGFGPLGRAGVGGLTEAAGHDEAEVRARAVDVLGDVGRAAGGAVPALGARLRDESSDVRALAADSLGIAGQGSTAAGEAGGRRAPGGGNPAQEGARCRL